MNAGESSARHTTMRIHFASFRFFALFCPGLLATALAAQQTAPDALPDAPGAAAAISTDDQSQQPTGPSPVHEDPQQKRIFGILPNFRSVTAGAHLPPQTIKDKFVTATEDSFDYSSFVLAAIVAGEADLADDTPEFGHGGVGYGRYLWHSFADQTSENYLVEFIIPSITHEDTRYYSLGKGGFAKRAGYSLSRAFITRTDSGRTTFNSSEIFGAGLSAGISNLYYPGPERTVGNTLDKWGIDVGIDTASFFVKEFYPDIYHFVFHRRIEPQTTP
jgi:hypothetical protein